jgi:uncharacterized membrane protein
MIVRLLLGLTFLAALSCGLAAGIFFAFSSLVMRALARISPPTGIAAMQSINVSVINPWFMGAFFGPAVICCFLAVISLLRWNRQGAAFILAGSALYLVGTMAVTFAFNVPLNDALAMADPASPEAPSYGPVISPVGRIGTTYAQPRPYWLPLPSPWHSV